MTRPLRYRTELGRPIDRQPLNLSDVMGVLLIVGLVLGLALYLFNLERVT